MEAQGTGNSVMLKIDCKVFGKIVDKESFNDLCNNVMKTLKSVKGREYKIKKKIYLIFTSIVSFSFYYYQ